MLLVVILDPILDLPDTGTSSTGRSRTHCPSPDLGLIAPLSLLRRVLKAGALLVAIVTVQTYARTTHLLNSIRPLPDDD